MSLIWRSIAALMLCRFAIITAMRAPLPFLSVIAASFGQGAENAGWLSGALAVAGLLGPVSGVLGQRFGQSRMTLIPMAVFVLACILVLTAPTLGAILALFVLLSVCRALFDPQMQSFVGEHVPFERRGRVVGLIELTYALSWMIGVPVFGWLAQYVTWQSAFVYVAGLALMGLMLLWRVGRSNFKPANPGATLSLESWRAVWATPGARWILLWSTGIVVASQMPYLIYPLWIQRQFGLNVAQLGYISIVLGLADLAGELIVAVLADRVGKLRMMLVAAVGIALGFAIWWMFSDTLAGVIAGLFVIYICFETALVTSLALAQQAVPHARAAMMGFNSAAHTAGRLLASACALALYGEAHRLGLVALVCAGAVCVSIAGGLRVRTLAQNPTGA